MTKEQSNYYSMFRSTQNFLDNETKVWSAIPKITNYKNELDEIISRITNKLEVVQASIGVTERKSVLRQLIGVKTASLSGILQAFAYETNDIDLVHKVKYSKTSIIRLKDINIFATVKIIVDVVQENFDKLADYGVNENTLTEILTALEEFKGLIGKPRSILNSRYVTLNSIEKLFNEGNSLLRNKLDKIMLTFQESSPEFYNGYRRARTIVDR